MRRLAYEDDEVAHRYDKILEETMTRYFQLIRRSIDEVSPALHSSFCTVEFDFRFSAKFAKILAGDNGPAIIRINNGRYLNECQRDVPQWLRKTAKQIVPLHSEAILLAEPDTCSHNRYCTGAYAMLEQITLSLLEGCKGGKFWITRMSNHEPASGIA